MSGAHSLTLRERQASLSRIRRFRVGARGPDRSSKGRGQEPTKDTPPSNGWTGSTTAGLPEPIDDIPPAEDEACQYAKLA